MNLGEFLNEFSHNNLIRLLVKTKGGHTTLVNSFDKVYMDWEIKEGAILSEILDTKVVGLASICTTKYSEAINIVLERDQNVTKLMSQKLREEVGFDLMLCKSALIESDYNYEVAKQIIEKKSKRFL